MSLAERHQPSRPAAAPAGGPAMTGPLLVVGVSESAASRAALRWALREAQRRDGRVAAVSVWPGDDPTTRQAREQALVAVVRQAVEDTGVRGRTWVRLLQGQPPVVLLTLARQADVLVLGTHSHG